MLQWVNDSQVNDASGAHRITCIRLQKFRAGRGGSAALRSLQTTVPLETSILSNAIRRVNTPINFPDSQKLEFYNL